MRPLRHGVPVAGERHEVPREAKSVAHSDTPEHEEDPRQQDGPPDRGAPGIKT
jgi:hypothetical protein